MNNFECPRCGHCCQALEEKQEPFEYWNAVEGWVKIDEVREHFDAVGCGTIYKSGGEGRSPLYTAPPLRQAFVDADDTSQERVDGKAKREHEWVGLTEEDMEALFLNEDGVRFARYIEAKLKERNE